MNEPVTGSRTRRRQRPEVRRAAILDAATGVFVERGIASTSMDEIAHSAGVAKGTVYLYFDSREDLVAALRARLEERLVERAERLLEAGSGERFDRFDRFASGVVDDAFDHADSVHVLLHEAPAGHVAFTDAKELLRRFIERGVGSGEFQVSDPDLAARFLLDGLLGVIGHSLHEPRPGKPAVRAVAIAIGHGVLLSND